MEPSPPNSVPDRQKDRRRYDRRRERSGASAVPTRRRRYHRRWLDRVAQFAGKGGSPDDHLAGATGLVTASQGSAVMTFKAWELVSSASETGEVMTVGDRLYQRIGTRFLTQEEIDRAGGVRPAFDREYRRAYEAIYRENPEIRGVGLESGGLVLVPQATTESEDADEIGGASDTSQAGPRLESSAEGTQADRAPDSEEGGETGPALGR